MSTPLTRATVGSLAEAVADYNPEDPLHDYINRTLPKRELDAFIAELVHEYGAHSIASVLDMIKTLGFKYATQAGVTISQGPARAVVTTGSPACSASTKAMPKGSGPVFG